MKIYLYGVAVGGMPDISDVEWEINQPKFLEHQIEELMERGAEYVVVTSSPINEDVTLSLEESAINACREDRALIQAAILQQIEES